MSYSSQEHKSSSVSITDSVVAGFVPEKVFRYHQDASVTSLDFDDTGQFLISAGVDKSIQLYDVHKGIHHKDIQSQKYGAHSAKFTHHELNCLYASTPGVDMKIDHAIRYLSLADNQYIRYFKGHKEQVTNIEVHPILDTFLSSSLDRSVKLWDLRCTLPAGSLGVGQPCVVAFDPKGIIFAVGKYPDPSGAGLNKGQLELYSMTRFDKGPFLTIQVPTIPGQRWTKLEFSNNGKHILVSTDGFEHYVVDAFKDQVLTTLQAAPDYSPSKYNEDFMTFEYPSTASSCFSPCGKYVFVGTNSPNVLVYDLKHLKSTDTNTVNYQEIKDKQLPFTVLSSNRDASKIVAFNPKLLTFATANTSVSLWRSQNADG